MVKRKVKEFAKSIDLKFNNYEILQTALTHRSYINEVDEDGMRHNERLEFLGDAVLELIVSEFLFETYSDRPEGELTSFRAATVRTDSLAETSKRMNVGAFLLMSKGEEATGGRDKNYLLANAFESILGAIYIDQDYDACKEFVNKWLLPKIDKIVKLRLDIDAKTKFQEISQSLLKMTPEYKLITQVGPDHEKTFTMGAYVGDTLYGKGKGKSKQRAEEEAAKEGLKKLRKMNKSTTIA